MTGHLNSFKERSQQQFDSSELDRRLLELSALFEISETLNSSLNLQSILDNLLLVPMGRMMISKGLILFSDGKHKYNIQHQKGLPRDIVSNQIQIDELPTAPLLIADVDCKQEWCDFFKNLKIELLIPLADEDNFRGIIGYGKKLSGQNFTQDEIQFLASLGNIASQSIMNARMLETLNSVNRSLDQKVQELNTLFEIGRELNQIFDKPTILKQLSFSLMGQMMVNQFFVLLREEDNLEIAFHKGANFSPDKLNQCLAHCRQMPEIWQPEIFPEDHPLKKMGVELIVPMEHQSKINGYIFLGSKLNQAEFGKHDLSFLSTLANMVIIAIENSRLIRETIEKERLEEELNLAKIIQRQLLPSRMPEIEAFDIHGLNLPSKQVGGDYFDIIPLSKNEYIFTIADVSGKGMPAALLMSNLQAGLHSLADGQHSLEHTTSKLNKLIHRNTTVEKYITFFIMQIDTVSGEFHFVNAGHNPPYMFHANMEYNMLEEGGLILGMMPEAPYQTGSGKMNNGDSLVMFTDGVTEAMSETEEEFGESGVIRFCVKHLSKNNSKDFNDLLLKELSQHANGDPTSGDDVTLLTIKYLD